jgi:hypothetical protein
MSITEGCQYHAGVIDADGKLKKKAKTKFIQECKEELVFGTENLPTPQLFPCGPKLQPIQFAELLDLENESKFPEFHNNILGTYEKIANTLNLASDLKFLPICCPVSLGLKLGVNLKLKFPLEFIPFIFPNLPDLAVKLDIIPPIELALKFPTLPSIPPPLPKFDIPPDIKIPDFSTFFDFTFAFSVGIPKLLADIALDIPNLILKLPNLPELFGSLCDLAFKSNIFGDVMPISTTQIVAIKVLTKRVVEMSFIAAVGTTLGSSPGGITGGTGRYLGYEPPGEESDDYEESVRDKIVNYAYSCAGLSWGLNAEKYAQKILYTEYGDGTPKNKNRNDYDYDERVVGSAGAIQKCSEASSCGMFARACLWAAGASYVFEYNGMPLLSKVPLQDPTVKYFYNFYSDEYRVLPGGGIAIAGLIQSAQKKGAIYPYTKGDLPPLKRGDVIIIHNPEKNGTDHAIVVVEDYIPGSFNLKTVEGGQQDASNKNKPTGISMKEYVHENSISDKGRKIYEPPFSMQLEYATDELVMSGRKIKYLINSEIVCTSAIGSTYTGPHSALNIRLAADKNDNLNPSQYIAKYVNKVVDEAIKSK